MFLLNVMYSFLTDVMSSNEQPIHSLNRQQAPCSTRKPDAASNLISAQAILSAMWSPSVDCGLTTPPTSHPPSPGGSMMDQSLTSSFHMTFGDPSSSLTTPRDSPHSALSEEQSQRIFNTSEGNTPNKSGRKSRGKVPAGLPRHPANIQRTTSAPSTPGYDATAQWPPASPIRKHSTDRTVFNFGGLRQTPQQTPKGREIPSGGSSARSRQSSGKGSGMDESLAEEDAIPEENERSIKCPKARQEESTEEQETSVSLKDLASVIRHLSDGQIKSGNGLQSIL